MSDTIRVAVNLTWVAPGRVGGSEEYLVRQLSGLADGNGIEPTIYCQPAFATAHPGLGSRFPVVTVPLQRDRRSTRILAEHSWLAARTRSADVVHHGGGTAPLIGRRPILLTVHDLQYLRYPEYFGRGRHSYLDRMMPRSVRRAATVAVPSQYVAGRIVEQFGIDSERVVVVPHGVPGLARPTDEVIAATRARHRLGDRPFVVYPAITHPHKGHAVLVAMLDHLDPEIMVVMVGGAGAAEAHVERAIAASSHAERVVRTGRVQEAERDALIYAASALVFPSEYEGFGAPVVEAMVLETPVVCSDAEAVVEVVGDAAVIVADPSPEAWADGVRRAIEQRHRLIESGRARRQHFTLEGSGRALAEAYRRAAGS
jgi:glycosyltransferase involved in cell wall biosynthesis